MKRTQKNGRALAASLIALNVGASLLGQAFAEETSTPTAPEGAWDEALIVPNLNLSPFTPPPGGVLDTGVTGIGQMVTAFPVGTGFSVGLCTGTLINPRAVLFAAHCVNDQAASTYGAASGGTPMSFGFQAFNRPAVVSWLFSGGFRTNTANALYNVNHLWYDPRSLNDAAGGGFLEADIAIATLDTPATDIPTWALLFSPLTAPTHAQIVGYGATGTATAGAVFGIDFRRRAAENMLDSLASLDVRNDFLFGPDAPFLPQTLYSTDFDDPRGQGVGFNFDLFDGAALPRESATAGGDSGGPLIADQAFSKPVVVGTLSGGSRFFGPQPFSSYGTQSFYQPLFLFWDAIVQNNPYVYASAKRGNGDWFDPTHWVQDMDPNYAVVRNGQLTNDLPDTPAQGVTGETARFGRICFLDDCLDVSQGGAGTNSTGPGLTLAGGPGSTGFVPNNVSPNPIAGVRPRYYDVTLDQIGQTWLKGSAVIDRLTVDGSRAVLDVRSGGSLDVLGDFTQVRGWVHVDGRLDTGEALLVSGLLSGAGTLNPTYLTNVAGVIAPGGVKTGTLTIQGDVVLSSGAALFMQLGNRSSDLLSVRADAVDGTPGSIGLGGTLALTRTLSGSAPRHGQVTTIVQADGQVLGQFGSVFGIGILQPTMQYGPKDVKVLLLAGRFDDDDKDDDDDDAEEAIAEALDRLRERGYGSLSGLYGELDLVDRADLARTFAALAPRAMYDAHGLMDMQRSGFTAILGERMGSLARGDAPAGFAIMGAPEQLLGFGDPGSARYARTSYAGARTLAPMTEGMSAFVAGGYDEAHASPASGRALSGDAGMRSWSMVSGLEWNQGDVTFGVATGYARGEVGENRALGRAENDLAQSVSYGVWRFGDAYVSALVGAGFNRSTTERRFIVGQFDNQMRGDASGDFYQANAETGFNLRFGGGLTVTPKLGLRHTGVHMDAWREGGGEAALAFDAYASERTEVRTGASLAGDVRLARQWLVAPALDVAFVQNLSGDEDGMWARFAAAPEMPFLLPGARRDEAWGEIGGGLRFERGPTRVALSFEASAGRDELHEDRARISFAHNF